VNSRRGWSAVVDPIAHARNEAAIRGRRRHTSAAEPEGIGEAVDRATCRCEVAADRGESAHLGDRRQYRERGDTTAVQPICAWTVRSGIRASTPRVAADSNPT
jgi:hypothetical protein